MKRTLSALGAALLLATGCGLGGPSLEDTHADCRIFGDDVSLSYNSRDDVLTLRSLDRDDEQQNSELADNAQQAYECLTGALDIPEDLQSQIGQTTVRDREQAETFSGINVTWVRESDAGTRIDFAG